MTERKNKSVAETKNNSIDHCNITEMWSIFIKIYLIIIIIIIFVFH